MTIQIRDAVYETNSSSSHSVTVSADELADYHGIAKEMLRSGVLRAKLRDFGTEWGRFYSPGAKIAYLVTQIAGGRACGPSGKDVTRDVRQNPRVDRMLAVIEKCTGCRVEVIGSSSAFVDHASAGIGLELLDDTDQLLKFVCGQNSYVETGNDNSEAPMVIETDRGDESYHEGRYVSAPEGGERFEMTLDFYGANVFMRPDGGEPIYAYVDDQDDLNTFVTDLDGLVIDKIGVWCQRPESLSEEDAADEAEEFAHLYLKELTKILPDLKILREVTVDSTFDVSAKEIGRWDRRRAAQFTLFATSDPEKVARMTGLLSRHSGMSQAHP